MAPPRVKVDTRGFRRMRVDVNDACRDALEEAGDFTVKRARERVGSRSRSGAMAKSIERTPVERTPRGFATSVSVGVFYGRFQEMGTGARKGKTKSKKVREKRVAAGISASGVKGQRFLRGAVAEARPVLERAIARRVSG